MSVFLWQNSFQQFFDQNGLPLSGGKLYFFAAGTTTKVTTYTTNVGNIPNSNPLILDASGYTQQAIWLTGGTAVKVGLTLPTEPDPPTNFIPPWPLDNVRGIGDNTAVVLEWLASGFTPTYISATSFSVPGDQTSVLSPRIALKIVDAGGTKYGWVKTSVFGAVTTITLDQNSAALASPISSVSYGILSPINPSEPIYADTFPIRSGSADESKQWRVELDQNTTGVTRATTIPNYDHRMMTQTHGADIASAATLVLDTATGDLVDVTGTTGITAITLAEGREATVRFTGVLTLTNGASLVLPGLANITTAIGDFAVFRGYAAGVVRCTSYSRIAPATGGASMVLLSAKTASTSAAINYGTSDFDWTIYDEYEFHFVDILPDTDSVNFLFRISQDGGSSYISTATYGQTLFRYDLAASSVTTATGTSAVLNPSVLSNVADNTYSFVLVLKKPSAVGPRKKMVTRDSIFINASGSLAGGQSIANQTSTAAYNGISFFMGTGNIASGSIYTYGIKKS